MKFLKSIHATLTKINPYGDTIGSCPLSLSKYNQNGHKIYHELFNESGEIENKIIHEVDVDGKVISEIHYERLTDLTERTDYFDTEDNVQYKAEVTKTDGSKLIYEFNYNQLGNTDRVTIKYEDGSIEAYEHFRYNDDNLLIEEVRTNTDSITQFSKKLFYDNENILTREEYYSENNKLNRQVDYSYNNQGFVSEKRDVSQEFGTASVSHYFYDESGNQILDETYANGILNFTNECQYDEWNNLIEEKVIQLGVEFNSIEIIRYDNEYW